MKKHILFICKHNRFRSKIAEAIFKKLNKNRNFKVKSAGIIKSMQINLLQNKLARKLGIIINNGSTGISAKLLSWADIIIIAADDVPISFFNEQKKNKKLILWKIPDSKRNNIKNIIKIIKMIEDKVVNFIRVLK